MEGDLAVAIIRAEQETTGVVGRDEGRIGFQRCRPERCKSSTPLVEAEGGGLSSTPQTYIQKSLQRIDTEGAGAIADSDDGVRVEGACLRIHGVDVEAILIAEGHVDEIRHLLS